MIIDDLKKELDEVDVKEFDEGSLFDSLEELDDKNDVLLGGYTDDLKKITILSKRYQMRKRQIHAQIILEGKENSSFMNLWLHSHGEMQSILDMLFWAEVRRVYKDALEAAPEREGTGRRKGEKIVYFKKNKNPFSAMFGGLEL